MNAFLWIFIPKEIRHGFKYHLINIQNVQIIFRLSKKIFFFFDYEIT